MIRTAVAAFCAASWLVLVPAAPAMEMELAGDSLYLHGSSIGLGDWVTYKELTQGRQFSNVVLVNQGGGEIETALGIARDLIDRRVTTVLLGYCYSACTYIFLAGERRQFGSTWPLTRTRLGFHSVYDRATDAQSRRLSEVGAYYESRVQGKAWELLAKALVQLHDRRGLLYSYHPAHRVTASLCPGSIDRNCERFENGDAVTLGLVTTRELAEVALPEKLVAREQIFGVEWAAFEPVSQPQELARLCPAGATACLKSVGRFAGRPTERAFALSKSGKTGSSWQFNHPQRAAWRALYECARSSRELCRIAAVNDYPMLGLYERWETESGAARQQLKGMAPETLPEERYENAELRMRALRTDNFAGTTPESIPGAREVTTRQLAQLIAGPGPLELVDVACAERTLPAAKCIFGAGLAYSDPKADEARERLFLDLLRDLAPDAGVPIVIFSGSNNSWLSANAVFRAAKAARNVLWYRGGIAAWKNAGLPTVPTAPVGAVTQ